MKRWHALEARQRVFSPRTLFTRLLSLIGLACVVYALVISIGLAAAIYRVEEYIRKTDLRADRCPVPAEVASAFVAAEDARFFQHHGVDWSALRRAIGINLRQGKWNHGGSTITMQVTRYMFLTRERTLNRKFVEIPLALYLDARLTKTKILQMYLNSAYFGLGAYTIHDAAMRYFGKQPYALSLAEGAFLAGVLPEPPRTREAVTLDLVARCRRRGLRWLTGDPKNIAHAQAVPLHFVWDTPAGALPEEAGKSPL